MINLFFVSINSFLVGYYIADSQPLSGLHLAGILINLLSAVVNGFIVGRDLRASTNSNPL